MCSMDALRRSLPDQEALYSTGSRKLNKLARYLMTLVIIVIDYYICVSCLGMNL